jgi:anaphase-promoting complex subunit 6
MSLLRARCYEALGNRQFAIQSYRKALALDVMCFDALNDLVSSHMLSGAEEKALVAQLPYHTQLSQGGDVVAALYGCKLKKVCHALTISIN